VREWNHLKSFIAIGMMSGNEFNSFTYEIIACVNNKLISYWYC